MDILRLLEELMQTIDDLPRMGPVTWGLDRDDISMQISKIRASLPQEVKAAASTVRESDRILEAARQDASTALGTAQKDAEKILEEARKEADRVLSEAKMQQERMVSESEILKLCKAQSEEVRNAADREAVMMRRGAEKYAFDVLSQLEGVVGKVATTIERSKQELQPSQPATPTQAVAAPRERVRV
ncbi:MAG TPA: hypothetical protein VG944_10180 [Fimbriimonas sp.]|nr:hypothetical protein [Fimbriimonas sp.]